MSFHELPSVVKTIYLTLIFSCICISFSLFGFTYHKKSKLTSFLLTFSGIWASMILMLYSADLLIAKSGLTKINAIEWYCDHNILISAVPILMIVALIIFIAVKEHHYRRVLITNTSMRESVNSLSTGLCFSYENGRVLLLNRVMYDLCFKIVGKDLQNANLFWEKLCKGDVLDSVKMIEEDINPSYRLADGSVWTFKREKINDYYQLSASEITEILLLTEELEKNNEELVYLNRRLKKYGEDVDELTRSQERLELKARIHRQLGQALLATRRYLSEPESNEPPMDIWKQSVMLLSKEAQIVEESPMDMLVRFATKTGLDVHITGDFPGEDRVLSIFFQAAAEALTNAVKHANAKTIYIDLTENETHYKVEFRNDGDIPRTSVREGGGLTSLRKKVEFAGGTMSVNYKNEFILTIIMKKEVKNI